jgi:N-acetylglucosamine-6-phosphate deacetylase
MRLHQLGLTSNEALNAAVARPAQLLGISAMATLTPGTPANFFILNERLEIERRVTPREVVDLA